MRAQLIRTSLGLVALALLLRGPQAVAMDSGGLPGATADAMAQMVSPQAIAEYRRKLAEYQEIHGAFEQEAGAYWRPFPTGGAAATPNGATTSRSMLMIMC